MKIVVADPNLVPHRERFEAAVPPDGEVCWHAGGGRCDELRDADVYVGSRFTAEMAAAAEKLRLIHVAGAGTDKIDFDALAPDVLVANTFHHERSIAEYVVAAAVMLRRDFLAQDRRCARGVWATSVLRRCDPTATHAAVTRASDSSASATSAGSVEPVPRLRLHGCRRHRVGPASRECGLRGRVTPPAGQAADGVRRRRWCRRR